MFQKRKKIGEIHKTSFDWGEFFGFIFICVIGLFLLVSCGVSG